MERSRSEDIASLALFIFLGAIIVSGLRNGDQVGALPFLLAAGIREFVKGRRRTSAPSPPPPTS
jgi:hypothetical protein